MHFPLTLTKLSYPFIVEIVFFFIIIIIINLFIFSVGALILIEHQGNTDI
jgi:hypothetical protein